MFAIGPVAFATPWLLSLLVALPILWLILRAVPPAPITRRFPGVALLLGLEDPEAETDKTPWWLLLLRALAVAALVRDQRGDGDPVRVAEVVGGRIRRGRVVRIAEFPGAALIAHDPEE